MSWKPLEDQETAVKKVLGDDAKFPAEKADLQALVKTQRDSFDAFAASRDELEQKLEALENATDAFRNGVKLVAASFAKDDFGLDPKKKDDAKKIKQAQQTFAAFFAGQVSQTTASDKHIDEMQKHLEQLGKYKGPDK